MMEQTISVHNGSSRTVGMEHNARVAAYLKCHVNQDHVIEGGYYKTIVHENLEDAINRIFADALEEYNAKKRADKKHPGRTIDNYYEHLMNQLNENKKRKAVNGNKAGYEAMQPCYEMILQIGNYDTVNSRTNDVYDPEKLDYELAEEMLFEAIEKTKKIFVVPAVDKNGNPILDENGNQIMWQCIEIVGMYLHDDEKQKGIHVHIDYVPVAHGYKRGLSMQPGLNNALLEMGLASDKLEDVAEERTRIMKERFGIDYHDSDYVDKNGKQIPVDQLTEEQRDNRKLASKLVPCRTAQMKLQDLFRENIKAVMQEHDIPVSTQEHKKRKHQDKRDFAETVQIKAANYNAKLEKQELEEDIKSLTEQRDDLDNQIDERQEEIDYYDEKKETMTAWKDAPKSEKDLMKRIDAEVTEKGGFLGKVFKAVPVALFDTLIKLACNCFKYKRENELLKESMSMEKVHEAGQIIKDKNEIIKSANSEAEGIIYEADREAHSIKNKLSSAKEIQELENELRCYKEAAEKNESYRNAVEEERILAQGKKLKIAL